MPSGFRPFSDTQFANIARALGPDGFAALARHGVIGWRWTWLPQSAPVAGRHLLRRVQLRTHRARRQRAINAAAPAARKLTAHYDGCALECKPTLTAADRAGLERLLRYGARPAFAHERVEQLPNGNGSSRLPKTFYTGQTHVVVPSVEFLRRLAALMPPPRFHTIRFHGLFAPNANLRLLACALAPGHVAVDETLTPRHACPDPRKAAKDASDNPDAPHRRRTRMLWSQLLRRVFAVDVLRCPCGADADRKLIAVLARSQSPDARDNFLRAIGEPPRAAASRKGSAAAAH